MDKFWEQNPKFKEDLNNLPWIWVLFTKYFQLSRNILKDIRDNWTNSGNRTLSSRKIWSIFLGFGFSSQNMSNYLGISFMIFRENMESSILGLETFNQGRFIQSSLALGSVPRIWLKIEIIKYGAIYYFFRDIEFYMLAQLTVSHRISHWIKLSQIWTRNNHLII